MRDDIVASGETRRGRLAAERPCPVARIALIDADLLATLGPPHQLGGRFGHPTGWRNMSPPHRAARVRPAESRVYDVGVGIPVVPALASGRMRVDAFELIAGKSDRTR
ncbi:hypothetical protein [Roseivivax marinus]|uniref:hypothetical protein n=1 Tax=Roseivivax marinus TaxID=1379903 RepID=UPI001114357D|nr:hypothetical protein [Roseivivax marinus]